MSRKQMHTTYNSEKGVWENRKAGSDRASSTGTTKAEAVEKARTTSQNQNLEHVIHKQNGKIQERNSYGNDPHPPKG